MSAPSTTSSRRSAPPRKEIVPGSGSVAWRHVIGFVVLAYGLAWAIWAALLGPRSRWPCRTAAPQNTSPPQQP
jgi:hypothetical protein